MPFSTLLLDIDGVLVDENNNLNIDLCNYLQQLEQRFLSIHIVTARPMVFASYIIDSFSSKDLIHIFDNGAFVSDLKLKNILAKETIKSDYLLTIVDAVENINHDVKWGVSSMNKLYTNGSYINSNEHARNEVVNKLELLKLPINSMWFYGLFPEDVTKLTQITNTEINLTHFIENDKSHSIFLQPKEISKLSGFEFLRKYYDIDFQHTIYIADSDSDIELLKKVGFRACPQNSTDNVKKISDFVSEEKNTLGTLEILKNLFPN